MTDQRGTVKPGGTIHDRRTSRAYWLQTGVIPRWQLVLVYALIVAASIAGLRSLGNAVDDNCARIHRIVAAGADILDASSVTPAVRAKWRAADCPTPEAP